VVANERIGSCQCGEVRYVVRGESVALVACHCTECQRQSGSAFGMSLIVPRKNFEISAGEPNSFCRVPDRGGEIECFFCPSCGVRIFHASTNMPQTFNVKAGTLDNTAGLTPAAHVFVARKQAWVSIPDGVPCFDTMPGA
jgi:hypothetical protein